MTDKKDLGESKSTANSSRFLSYLHEWHLWGMPCMGALNSKVKKTLVEFSVLILTDKYNFNLIKTQFPSVKRIHLLTSSPIMVKWDNLCILSKHQVPSPLAPSHPSNYTLPVFRLGLCSVLLVSLSSISILLLLSLSDKKSLCWDKESLSEWMADGVSDLWLAGDDDRDGDSKNFLIAGWLKTIVSYVFDPCKNERAKNKLLIKATKSRENTDVSKSFKISPHP